jgi:hypothetical protein
MHLRAGVSSHDLHSKLTSGLLDRVRDICQPILMATTLLLVTESSLAPGSLRVLHESESTKLDSLLFSVPV